MPVSPETGGMPRRKPPTPWWDFVSGALGDTSFMEAAERAGIDRSVFGRWRRGQGTTAEIAIRFARGFDENVLHALVACGAVHPDEVHYERDDMPVSVALRAATGEELAREVARRLVEAEVLDESQRTAD